MALFASPVSSTKMPARLGRFIPTKVLGCGGQGIVYLARDPQLDREVAIKTLLRGRCSSEQLIHEARNVAKLDHPAIVPLYEIEFEGDVPHLVYQFAIGQPLSTLIVATERPPVHRVLRLMAQVLDAISYAHEQGVVHRDLSPSNILVDDTDRPRILDFGAAVTAQLTINENPVSAVNYLPPECFSNGAIGAHSDVYSLGVILHELLVGRRLFTGDDPSAVIHKILHEKVQLPSIFNTTIDQTLDGIVMQALAREPAARFQTANDMQAALERYLNPEPRSLPNADKSNSAVDFLMRKIARKPDFPAVSRLVAEINQKSGRPESDDVNDLSNVILNDYALTSKLLRLVNSAVYGQYGGTITTVSRAVLILGFDAIRTAALSIAIFEHLKSGTQADALKDAACGSFLSAVLAKDLGQTLAGIDPEEAFIGAMFHRLGRHLAIYYFPDEFEEIRSSIAQRGISETTAARDILGTSYAEFGMAVAKHWNFPEKFQLAMTPQREGKIALATSSATKGAQLAAFANETSEAVAEAVDEKDLEARLKKLGERYAACIETDPKTMRDAVARAVEATKSYAAVLAVDIQTSSFFKRVTSRIRSEPQPLQKSRPDTSITEGAHETYSEQSVEDDRKSVLVNAVTEITNALLEQAAVNQIFSMVAEAFYRGIEFSHVLLMLRDPKRHMIQARFGFGIDIDAIVPKFGFKTEDTSDIFNEAMRKGRESIVLDVNSEQYAGKVPGWCRNLTNPKSVLLFPLLANRNCIGLIYADTIDHQVSFSVQELKLLNTLIKQASLAFNQRR